MASFRTKGAKGDPETKGGRPWGDLSADERVQMVGKLLAEGLRAIGGGESEIKGLPEFNAGLTLLELVAGALDNLHEVGQRKTPILPWVRVGESLPVEFTYAFPWSFAEAKEKGVIGEDALLRLPVPADLPSEQEAAEWVANRVRMIGELLLLDRLTHGSAYLVEEDEYHRLLPEGLEREVEKLPGEQQEDRLRELYRPYIVGGRDHPISMGENTLQVEPDFPFLTLTLTGDEGELPEDLTVSPVVAFFPLVIDKDQEIAYFPIQTGFQVEKDLSDSPPPPEVLESLWEALGETLNELVEGLIGGGAQEPLPGIEIPPSRPPAAAPARQPGMKLDPVPMPRAGAAEWELISRLAGPGRHLANLAHTPDLDRKNGAVALEAALRLFWERLEAFLENVGETYPLTGRVRRLDVDNRVTLTFPGLAEDRTRDLWGSFVRTLGAGAGGPGIEVRPPGFSFGSVMENGRVERWTEVELWPPENLRNKEGRVFPPVSFKRYTSPGYQEILAQQKGPYRADGYVWLPGPGGAREGFRLGGSWIFLFRKDAREVYEEDERNLQGKLQELLAGQLTFFPEERAALEKEILARLEEVRGWLRALSVFDTAELHRAVWAAWTDQKDAWAAGRLRLPDGTEVEQQRFNYIHLNPRELRLRLDPAGTWGDNWRGFLHEKLNALGSFERAVRNRSDGRIVERSHFFADVVDGFRDYEEEEEGPRFGLAHLLSGVGRWPIDAFFVSVNQVFVERIAGWIHYQDAEGRIHWREAVGKQLEKEHLAAHPGDKRGGRRKALDAQAPIKGRSYYDHSRRVQIYRNWKKWPPKLRDLSEVILQERTRGKKAGRVIGERAFVACNGRSQSGYHLKTWARRAGYEGNSWKRDLLEAFAVLAQEPNTGLGLHLETPAYPGADTEKTLAYLETAGDVSLRVWLPADIEDRLQTFLEEEGVVSPVDEEPFYRRLVIARKVAGLLQKDIASRLGVNQALVSRWERGEKPIPAEHEGRLREILGDYLPGER